MAISPIIDTAAQKLHKRDRFIVAVCTYQASAERPIVMGNHKTLKAACRTLASCCSNMRRIGGLFAAYVILPSGEPISLTDARKLVKRLELEDQMADWESRRLT